MVLIDSFVAFFTIFISPQILLYSKFNHIRYSLLISFGLIISFSISWIIFLILFFTKINNLYLYTLAISIFIYTLINLYNNKNIKKNNIKYIQIIWIITLLLMIPLFLHFGDAVRVWDAVVSWNRWAIEFFDNEYKPYGAAYPVLFPAIWGLTYKIQGSTDIWWTAIKSLFIVPIMLPVLLSSLYYESKNKTFLFILIFIYPYLIWKKSISGNMDIPVMLFGLISLILIYASELNRHKKEFEYYIYAALLFSGLSSIVKQAGLAFLAFNVLYIIFNIKYFEHRKKIVVVVILSFSYFTSFLILFYQFQDNITTLSYLEKLSASRAFIDKTFFETISYLANNFFSKPEIMTLLTPCLILIGFGLFINKDLRRYNTVGFLSGIFFIIGTILWIKYFSYDSRNSMWVKSFLIILASININFFLEKKLLNINNYIDKKIINIKSYLYTYESPKINRFSIKFIVLMLIILFISGNDFAYYRQMIVQQKIGNKETAILISELLKDKNKCVEVYTNMQKTAFNYHLKNFRDRINYGGWYVPYSLNFLHHNCVDGRYFIYGTWTKTRKNTGWEKIEALENDSIIIRINSKSSFIYFVPPNIPKRINE